jgi:hypothetical protein
MSWNRFIRPGTAEDEVNDPGEGQKRMAFQ